MHIMVLGAGVIGVTTAWYLKKAGYEVSVVDRRPEAGRETSFANGGQISVSHPEPWASPRTPMAILRWLGKPDAPLKFHPHAELQQWLWGLSFLYECLPGRHRRNTEAIATLARYSADRLHELLAETDIAYQRSNRGILHLFGSEADFARIPGRVEKLTQLGIDVRTCSASECVAIEPALGASVTLLKGGMYAPGDETGDAFRFTQALSERLQSEGVRFRFDTSICNFFHDEARVQNIKVMSAAGGQTQTLSADAYVVCMGSYGNELLEPLNVRLPVYPVKGYSVTIPIRDPERAPQVSLTDESRRIVCSRLGNRLRVAGMAEVGGFDMEIDPVRAKVLLDWADNRFPGALDMVSAETWVGLRPATPGNVPVIGKTRYKNLWLNTGHGTLGWTLACGSAALLTERIRGGRPSIAFPYK